MILTYRPPSDHVILPYIVPHTNPDPSASLLLVHLSNDPNGVRPSHRAALVEKNQISRTVQRPGAANVAVGAVVGAKVGGRVSGYTIYIHHGEITYETRVTANALWHPKSPGRELHPSPAHHFLPHPPVEVVPNRRRLEL